MLDHIIDLDDWMSEIRNKLRAAQEIKRNQALRLHRWNA
ncbi:hypothetical protein lbkm_0349 [Lachnospiraceae bacterium KM106-2]|nr:hypothetical protein lbkm_0349 [Lachnospiraceae bacterium KM106-2]